MKLRKKKDIESTEVLRSGMPVKWAYDPIWLIMVTSSGLPEPPILADIFLGTITNYFFLFTCFCFMFQIHSLKRVRIGGFKLPSDLG